MTFLLELRNAAMKETDVLARKLLRDSADEIEAAIAALAAEPTMDSAKHFNCVWARAWRRLVQSEETSPPRGGGRARPAKRQRVNADAEHREAA